MFHGTSIWEMVYLNQQGKDKKNSDIFDFRISR